MSSSSSRSASSSVGSLPSLLRSTSSVASSPPTSPECEPETKSGLSESPAAVGFESTRDDSTTTSEPFLDSASRSHLARARSPPAMDDSTSKDSLHSRVERIDLNGAERGDSESTTATAAAAGSSSSSPPRPTLATSTDSQSPVTPTATPSGTSHSPQVATPTGPTAAEATPESDSSISNPNPTRESDPTRFASSPPPVPSTQHPSMLSPSTTSTATNEASSEASTSAAPPLYPRQSAAPSSTINSASPPPATGATTATGGVKKPIGSAALRQGVRGAVGTGTGPLKMPPSLAAKMAAMTSRKSVSPSGSPAPGGPPVSNGGVPRPNMQPSLPLRTPGGNAPAPALAPRPAPRPPQPGGGGGAAAGGGPISSGALAGRGGPGSGGMAGRRKGPGLTLSQMGISTTDDAPSSSSSSSSSQQQQQQQLSPANGGATGLKRGLSARTGGMRLPGQGERPSLNGSGGPGAMARGTPASPAEGQSQMGGSPFSNFRKIVDPSGRLNFASKAILHSDGVDFSSGASFKIKMDEFELYEELGKGNYGTVQKVLHKPTGVTMALKEIRLELDDSKLKTIITELDILHRATSPYIVDFYGAFFIESCVYYCMEFMDAGSLDFFAGCDLPEDVLARITGSMVEGLKFLKDELKIMHRDVKPTNVLLNSKGQVKLCDFGVSGQLDRSLAKTNIGCQSYMAPERIKGESQGAPTSYTASSDVWSLGLSVIEAACGHYPYPPETYSNVFAQLTAIVHGDPPTLPDNYSATAQDFVQQCLRKQAHTRPTYKELLAHPFLLDNATKDIDMVGWIARATEYRKTHPKINAPALA